MAIRILEEPFMVVREDECKGCGLCVDACPKDVIIVAKKLNKNGFHPAQYIGEGCIGCGVCFYACPEPGAITVYKKGAEYEEVE